MAFEIQIDGMTEISEMLTKLEEGAQAIASRALYTGAGIMADAMRKEVDKIKTAPFKYAKEGETRLPSPEEKAALDQAPVGIAKFTKNGAEVDTSVGFNQAGYVEVDFNHMNANARTNYKGVDSKGKGINASSTLKYAGIKTKGQNMKPVGVIANAINSGTSFMQKQPFVRKGVKAGGTKAMQAMKDSIEQDINAMTK
ncbi:MAG: hypothetical protein IKS46_03495 [Clostridia bacterium]|nr:hypothetical protein [Clostridia bacterium]